MFVQHEKEMSVETKGVIRSRNSQNRNAMAKERGTNNGRQNCTQKIKDVALSIDGIIMVTLVTNLLTSRE
jgi:hypothetical protein